MTEETSEITSKMEIEVNVSTSSNPESEDGEIFQLATILVRLGEGKEPSSSEILFEEATAEEEPREAHSPELPSFDSKDISAAPSKKRQRTSPEQLDILEKIFRTDQMPSHQTRLELADKLGMSARRVQIWFQNKRAKLKRVNKDTKSPESPPSDSSSSIPSSPKDKPKTPKTQMVPQLPYLNFPSGVNLLGFSPDTPFNFQPIISKHLSDPKNWNDKSGNYRLNYMKEESGRMTLPQLNSGLVIGMS